MKIVLLKNTEIPHHSLGAKSFSSTATASPSPPEAQSPGFTWAFLFWKKN